METPLIRSELAFLRRARPDSDYLQRKKSDYLLMAQNRGYSTGRRAYAQQCLRAIELYEKDLKMEELLSGD